MPADVIIDPSTGQIYWNDGTGSPQSISIKGDAQNAISFVGYSGSYSPGSSVGGTQTLVTVNDNGGTDALIPGTTGFNLGSSTLRWNTFASNANLSGTLVVSDSTISSSLITGSSRINGGIAISGNASIGQSLNFYNTAATFYTGLKAGSVSANTLYTLPLTYPSTGTSVLQSDTSGIMSWVGTTSATPGGSTKQIQYNNAGSFGGASGFEYTTAGSAVTVAIFSNTGTGYTSGLWIKSVNGENIKVGIGLSNPEFELEINGEISAVNKSFVIPHPTKPNMKLRYGSLEGPENGVYIRGIATSNKIELPDYWLGLVDYNTITVHLTPIGNNNAHFFQKIEDNIVYIKVGLFKKINCFYSIWAERKDIAKLIVEY
jgi:hypothetical protein